MHAFQGDEDQAGAEDVEGHPGGGLDIGTQSLSQNKPGCRTQQYRQEVIYKGIPHNRQLHGIRSNRIPASQGLFTINKNVEMVVRGYARLLELHKTESDKLPYLVLGGKDFANKENADVVAINELINMLNIKDRVFYTGFFTDEDALDLLCGAKLFTHLSLYEGFGLSALEPMKCGVPTVASNCSCYPEILGKGALLVDPCNVNAIAEAFYKIISNIKFAKDLSLSGITQTSKYSLEKNAQETYNYLLEHAKHE